MLVIHDPKLESSGERVRATSLIERGGKASSLWFEVDTSYSEYIAADRADAFVLSCIFPALASGEDITVRGTLSPRLFYHLNHNLIPILQLYLDAPRRISVAADRLEPMRLPPGDGVMTGFSGGIDSFCNYYDHSGDRAPEGWRITHFVYNNVGSHGQSSAAEDEQIFKKRYESLARFTRCAGIEMLAVNSNIDAVVGLPFDRTHTLRNAAVALLLQGRFSKFLYASAFDYAHTRVGRCPTLGYLDPVILPMLGTERLECVPSGGQHSRVEKTRRVAEIPASRELLDVCVRPDKVAPGFINCSCCWKCMRTAITLAAMGKLVEFDRVFDIDMVRRYERIFLLDALSSRNPLQGEVMDLIRDSGYPIPRRISLIARFLPGRLIQRAVSWLWPRMIDRPRVSEVIGLLLGQSPRL